MYKTLRKVLLLFIVSFAVVFGSVFAVACGGSDDAKALAAPTGVAIDDNGVLSWNSVDHASGYIVYDGDSAIADDIASSEHSYDLNFAELSDGVHLISVAAKGDGKNYSDSPKSSTVSYTVAPFVGSGSKDNPYYLVEGNNDIDVPANGSVYYSVNLKGAALKYTLNSDDSNIKLDVYSYSDDSNALYSFDSGNLDSVEIDLDGAGVAGSVSYYFVFSTVDGSAAKYSVNVTIDEIVVGGDELGSINNPIIITSLGKVANATKSVTGTSPSGDPYSEQVSLYYQYTVAASVSKLYFAVDDSTKIIVTSADPYINLWSTDDSDLERLAQGVSVSAGAVITIEVANLVDAGPVSFVISDAPISETPSAPVTLDSPKNVKVTGTTLSWDAVDNASGYIVYNGDDILDANVAAGTLSYDLSGLDTPGVYRLYVQAKGDGENYITSAKSSGVNHTVSKKLDTPTNLVVNDGVLSWNSVENASYYRVYIDDSSDFVNVPDGATSYTLPTNLSVGSHTIYVLAGNSLSYWLDSDRASVQYTVEAKSSYDLVVGNTYTVESGDVKTIYLDADTYTIIVTGDYASHFRVKDDNDKLTSDQASETGILVEPGVTSTAVAFTVTTAGEYSLKFVDMSFDGHSCTIQIVTGDSSVAPSVPKEYRLTLNEAEEITTPAWSTIDYKFTSDAAGVYEITLSGISGSSYSVKVDNGDPIISGSATSGTFSATIATEYTITFYTGESQTFIATVSYKRPSNVDLTPSSDESSAPEVGGTLSGKSSAIDPDNTDALDGVGKLIFSNLKANYKYTLIVTFARGQFNDYKLVYNGKQYDSYLYDYTDYRVDFVAVEGVNEAYFYVINVNEDNVAYSLKLIEVGEVEEGDSDSVASFEVSITVSSWEGTADITSYLSGLEAGVAYIVEISGADDCLAASGNVQFRKQGAAADGDFKSGNTIRFTYSAGTWQIYIMSNSGATQNYTFTLTIYKA